MFIVIHNILWNNHSVCLFTGTGCGKKLSFNIFSVFQQSR